MSTVKISTLPPSPPTALTDSSKLTTISNVVDKWSNPHHAEDMTTPFDWRSSVLKKAREGDLAGMRVAALPSIQYNLIKLAHEAKDEKTQLAAGALVMGQQGQGPIQRVEHTDRYEKLPEDQLLIVLKSKMDMLAKLIPGFSLEKLLTQGVQLPGQPALEPSIEAEFTEVEGG